MNNQAGGFWNAVLNWEQWSEFSVYLQIEQGKLCFKISTHEDDIDVEETFDRGSIRNEFYRLIIKKAEEEGLIEIRKPDRFGNGNYMTSAIVDREKWIGSDTHIINPDEVIKRLEKYKSFLKNIITELSVKDVKILS